MEAVVQEKSIQAPRKLGYPRAVKIWLVVGLVMVFGQVVIGGITRLTGSGLSITKWEIVTGSVPPLNEQAWNAEFDLYKQTPQYEKINRGMSLSDFKFIYFWGISSPLVGAHDGIGICNSIFYHLAQGLARPTAHAKTWCGDTFSGAGGIFWLDYGSKWFDKSSVGQRLQINDASIAGIFIVWLFTVDDF